MSLTANKTALPLSTSGTPITVRFSNSYATMQTAKIYAACAGNLAPASGTLPTGKELIEEGCVEACVSGGTFAPIGFPETFTEDFHDLASNCLIANIGAGSYADIDFRLNIPGALSSSGVINFEFIVASSEALT